MTDGPQTFFSTDVVKYQNQNGGAPTGGIFSETAMQRWLQVTVPLTAITLLLSWATYRIAERTRLKKGLRTREEAVGRPRTWIPSFRGWRGKRATLPSHNHNGAPV